MPGPVQIGSYDKGFFSLKKDVTATETGTRGVSYEAALAATKRTAGADLIVARQKGSGFTYDVMSVDIKKTQVAGAGKFLKLVDNVPAKVGGSEAFLVDETNAASVLLPATDNTDTSRGRRAITHARGRDLDGAIALSTSIANGATATGLNQTFAQLKSSQRDMEAHEASLKTKLSGAEQALATKRAPYDAMLNQALATQSQTASKHRSIVSGKSEERREASNPGIHDAEGDVRDRQSDLNGARGELNAAGNQLNAARETLATADRLQGELDGIPYRVQTVNGKLDDYNDAVRDLENAQSRYRTAMNSYNAAMSRYENDLREYQNQPSNSQYQNQPSGSQYQNQPSGGQQKPSSGGQHQNQPSNSQYQNQPSNSQYQNQPSGSQYQNKPQPTRPTRPTEPSLRTPSSWSWGDSQYSLQNERRNLNVRANDLLDDIPDVRANGNRQLDAASDRVSNAQNGVARAENRLDASESRLRTLPAGAAAPIQAAQKNLTNAQTAESTALRGAQTTVDKARTALDVNTQTERSTVLQLQSDLKAAPNAFQAAIDAAARKYGL
ncbi:MAG: hypothetical protein H7338_06790 [Candidatus Sericytochromatia bacterium]|nr:hypothetical protein [Candidatus Sericytochromatia bacterium]